MRKDCGATDNKLENKSCLNHDDAGPFSLYRANPSSDNPLMDRVKTGLYKLMGNEDYRENEGGARQEEGWHSSLEG